MTDTPPKNLKARTKAEPTRLQEDLQNRKVIRHNKIIDNDFVHLAENDELSISNLPDSNISVPKNFWHKHKAELLKHKHSVAVQLAVDQKISELVDDFTDIDIIVLPIIAYTDGRSYSQTYLLRTRYHFQGEIRAVGDVHFDQINFLARVGVNAFELPDDDDHVAALSAFNEFSEVYQPSADDGQLIFAKRRTLH